MPIMQRQKIGKEKAIALVNNEWWKEKAPRDLAMFQMFTEEFSMPFDVFHESLEKALGRPVWAHELGLNWESLALELLGEKNAPTMVEIIELIPEEKRILIAV